MVRIPLVVVTGFLGAGKTTFIKEILKQQGDNYRIGIVQNEFAPVNADGQDLKENGKPFKILEINNGSLFCVCLLSDFAHALNSFVKEYEPDMIIIETSGLSDPLAMTEVFQGKELKDIVYLKESWTIIDCENFLKIGKMMNRAEHQLIIADHIVLNKIDCVDRYQIKQIKEYIHDQNPLAQVYESSFCQLKTDIVFSGKTSVPRAEKPPFQESLVQDRRPEMITGVFRSGKKIQLDRLKDLIYKYVSSTIRIKGYARLSPKGNARIQAVYNSVTIQSGIQESGNTALVFIGEKFNLSQFSRDFRALAE